MGLAADGAITAATAAPLISANHPTAGLVTLAVVAVIGGPLLIIGAVTGFQFVRAPYRQRDEARSALEEVYGRRHAIAVRTRREQKNSANFLHVSIQNAAQTLRDVDLNVGVPVSCGRITSYLSGSEFNDGGNIWWRHEIDALKGHSTWTEIPYVLSNNVLDPIDVVVSIGHDDFGSEWITKTVPTPAPQESQT